LGKLVADIPVDEAGAWSKRPGHVVWIGLFEPNPDLLHRVQMQFNLHPLAIEDAGKPHQQPKIEQYGEALFIVARTAQILDGRIAFGETHLFVGKGYVVSVRHGASVSYARVRERCESCPTVLSRGEDYILYALLDFIVDNYAPVLGAINEEVETMEDSILKKELEHAAIDRLYMLRRDLLRLRNAAAPLLDVCQRLEHADVLPIDASMQPLFRDVTDHVRRIKEEIDTLREVLAFAFEASLMTGQINQTGITRRLAAWAAILAVPTAVAGIYGMNFKHMPELEWEYGYFVVVAVILTVCGTLYMRFRKNSWL
jgi:magnesium transporter